MRTINQLYISPWMLLLTVSLVFLFSSCKDEEHVEQGGLVVAITWADQEDQGTEVK